MTSPADAEAKAHIVVADVATPELDERAFHHLARVLRLRARDPITVTDGGGNWAECLLPGGWPGNRELQSIGPKQHVLRRPSRKGVGFALTKGDKPDLVVQKLTELGVDLIVPFVAEHSVVIWEDKKARRNVERWREIAREAAQQSRQAWLPTITEILPFESLVGEAGATFGRVVRADRGGLGLAADGVDLVLVGPEGGWSDAERAAIPSVVSLGSTVLRAETAAIVAGALLGER